MIKHNQPISLSAELFIVPYLYQRQVDQRWGLTSAPTQYGLYGRRFLQVWWPKQQCQSTEGGWL